MFDITPIPFATDVHLVALPHGGIVIAYRDQGGRTLARSVADADHVESLARALLAIASVSRSNIGAGTKLGHSPRTDVNLMRHLVHGPVVPSAIIHHAPPAFRMGNGDAA